MGRKSPRRGQHLQLLLAAGLILLLLGGCAARRPKAPPQARLAPAAALLATGDYGAAARELDRLNREAVPPPPDEVLFLRALMAADPRNPKADPLQAAEDLDTLARRCPDSPRIAAAGVLRALALQLALERRRAELLAAERQGLQTHLRETRQKIQLLEQRLTRLKQVDLGTEQLKQRKPS